MDKLLFTPKQMEIPQNLILIPHFWDSKYFKELKEKALATFELFECEILLFDNYTLLVGFLGYPHLLTHLEFIKDVKEKEIFFLGTAGSMNEEIDKPTSLSVEAIYSTAILDHFCTVKSFPLKTINSDMRKAKGVTVDIIQRETHSWLLEQIQRGMDFVEMEIFPLRAYLEKPFHAVVVTSDLLKTTGITVFPDKKRLQEEFVKSYELIIKTISTNNF
ncbi:MAG: hypothetical protein MUF15_26885 [Acidobacteria bacterium]|jgi:hypothetical protein|nr:hypothetical protein [Acidobacteriota bacterium]